MNACTITERGSCVSISYGDNERCSIEVLSGATLSSLAPFDTEEGYDYLTIEHSGGVEDWFTGRFVGEHIFLMWA